MNPLRRQFLARFRDIALLPGVWTALLFSSMRRGVTAAEPDLSLKPDRFETAMRRELNGERAEETDEIALEVPDVAEDGAIVPVSIQSSIPGTERLVLLVEKNPFPQIAAFQFGVDVIPFVSLRIKINESSSVTALARARGRYYQTSCRVRVVRGGCS